MAPGAPLVNQAEYMREYRKVPRNIRRRREYMRSREVRKQIMLRDAKKRAKRQGVPFRLKLEHLEIPERCPALGIRLRHGVKKFVDGSPTLDRIVPSRGYVPGNVVVVSHKANRIKSNATAREVLLVARFYMRKTKS